MGAIGGTGLGSGVVAAELGALLGGQYPGRTMSRQIMAYGGVGLAFQNFVAAWQVYTAAREGKLGQMSAFLE